MQRTILHPFTTTKRSAEGARVITRAEGVYLYDGEGKRKLLDGMSGLWCVAVGYGRKRSGRQRRAADAELPYYNSFFQCANPPAIELSREAGGGDAAAVQACLLHGLGQRVERYRHPHGAALLAAEGQPERNIIIGRWNGYHGSTIAGASLGGMKWPCTRRAWLPIPGISHIEQPYWFERGGDLTRPSSA
jgi:putrescine aminotransferase